MLVALMLAPRCKNILNSHSGAVSRTAWTLPAKVEGVHRTIQRLEAAADHCTVEP